MVPVGVVHKPDDLVGEQLAVVLRGQVRFGRLRREQLETFANTFAQHVQRRILVNLLPQMGAENLAQRNFQGWYFTVHEDAGQIELHLKTDVDVRSIDCRRPLERETTIRNLVQTGTLGIGQFFVFHRFFEACWGERWSLRLELGLNDETKESKNTHQIAARLN